MAKLAYKTRGNSNPQGKERVFFTCHPDDFNINFESICEDIFKTQNCAIWYDEEPETAWDPEEMETELGRMQLFVIPVTTRFLYQENAARETLFRFSMEHHIPVLPLMQEKGLEEAFNLICGDLQFLDKNAAISDSTTLPYEQKLERFLSSVLLGDELVEKVRKAFDAYIFLSYRKKDRKYAQELMRLIHQNDFCRDIAIWYDEFLVPGEDFNHAIQDAMEKSELFTFVVTPNLLEQGNYVMKVEYPVAKETGKPILPAEMVPTDYTALRKNYSDIPEPADAHDAPVLSDALMQGLRNLAIEENDDDPGHLFFIGLAYLSGIDVEENRERGVQLITAAAEGNVPEAMEKLSQMYNNGEGVERDYEASAQWLEKLADYWEKKFEEGKNEETGRNYFSVLKKLGYAWYSLRRLEQAAKTYGKMLAVSEQMLEQSETNEWKCSLGDSFYYLGKMSEAEQKLSKAKIWYKKDLEISETLSRETGTVESRRNLGSSYDNLGDICKKEGKLEEAKTWYEKGLEIRELLSDETDTAELRRGLSISYLNLGNLCKEMGRWEEARSWYKKEMEICKALNSETDSIKSRSELSLSYVNLGDICRREGRLEESKSWYEKGLEIREALNQETGTIEARRDLSISYNRQGDLCTEEEKLGEARAWYEKGLEIREALIRETSTAELRRDLSFSYDLLGDLCIGEKKWGEARTWYEKEMKIEEALSQETGTVEARRDLSIAFYKMGNLCKLEENLGDAKEWYKKGQEISEALIRETELVNPRRDLCICYNDMGMICVEEGKLDEARIWYKNELKISEALSREVGSAELYHKLAFVYLMLGLVDENDLDIIMINKARDILQQLSENHPDESKYKDQINEVDLIIKQGRRGGLINYENASEYYLEAVKQGDKEALAKLSECVRKMPIRKRGRWKKLLRSYKL